MREKSKQVELWEDVYTWANRKNYTNRNRPLLIVRFSLESASVLIGTVLAGTTIAALIGRRWDIEFAAFPNTIVGIYLYVRSIIFFWTPGWWPVLFSDLIVLYCVMTFAVFRGWMAITLLEPTLLRLNQFKNRRRILDAALWPISFFRHFSTAFSLSTYAAFFFRMPGAEPTYLGATWHLIVSWVMILTVAFTGIFAYVLLHWRVLQGLAGF